MELVSRGETGSQHPDPTRGVCRGRAKAGSVQAELGAEEVTYPQRRRLSQEWPSLVLRGAVALQAGKQMRGSSHLPHCSWATSPALSTAHGTISPSLPPATAATAATRAMA